MALSKASPGSRPFWIRDRESQNALAINFTTEGYWYLLNEIAKSKVVDEVFVIIESNSSPGIFKAGLVSGVVIPEFSFALEYLKEDDIIWVRGGFKSWIDTILKLRERAQWILFYGANTGRERWPFWDIVLNDLTPLPFLRVAERVYIRFTKPINPAIFFPMDERKRFDFCIGASNIHDKKGQWKVLEALLEWKVLDKHLPTCVLPGGGRGAARDAWIHKVVREHNLSVLFPGSVPRFELAHIFNQSRVSIFIGGGQNDRGPLESLQCGTPIMIGSPQKHPAYFGLNPGVCRTVSADFIPTQLAAEMQSFLGEHYAVSGDQQRVVDFFQRHNGFETVVLPEMLRLLKILVKHPKVDLTYLERAYAQ
jgi:hypothetical protein